jgi:colicin import membrane protein
VVVDSSVLDVLDKEKQRKEQQKKQQKKQQQLQAEKKRQQEVERIKKEKLEQQRLLKQKELEEKKKLEEQKRLQEQERLEEERRLLEQAQQEEWEKIKAEEQAAAEQARSRELATNMDLYKLAIKQRVDRNWVRPLSVEDWYTCEVMVDQIPGGEVINVQILQCDGDAVFQRSVRNAVYKSSPLPDPQNPTLFDRRLKFTFRVPKE